MRKVLFSVVLLVLAACQPTPDYALQGRLYFASGNYVGEFDLADRSSVIIANRGDVTIRNVAAFGPGRLLLSELGTVEGRDAPRITWLDVETGRNEGLYAGVIARYLPRPAALVWDDGQRLHASARRRNSNISAEISSHNLNQLTAIVDVSDTMVLFESGPAEQRSIWSYDVITRELVERGGLTSACKLTASVWISDRARLVCPSRHQQGDYPQYRLVDIDGNVSELPGIPSGKLFRALAYAADQRALVFSESWSSLGGVQRYGVWAYDFDDQQMYRIVADQYLGNSAVYVRD